MLHGKDNNEINNLLVFPQNNTSRLAPILTYSQINVKRKPVFISLEINVIKIF